MCPGNNASPVPATSRTPPPASLQVLADNTDEPFRHLSPPAAAATAARGPSDAGTEDDQGRTQPGFHVTAGGDSGLDDQQRHPHEAAIERLLEAGDSLPMRWASITCRMHRRCFFPMFCHLPCCQPHLQPPRALQGDVQCVELLMESIRNSRLEQLSNSALHHARIAMESRAPAIFRKPETVRPVQFEEFPCS